MVGLHRLFFDTVRMFVSCALEKKRIWILDKRHWLDMSRGDIIKDSIVTTLMAFTPWVNIAAQFFVVAYIIYNALLVIDSSKHYNRFTTWLKVKPWNTAKRRYPPY